MHQIYTNASKCTSLVESMRSNIMQHFKKQHRYLYFMPVQESFNNTLKPLNYVVIDLTLIQPGVPYKVAINFHKVQNYCLEENGKQQQTSWGHMQKFQAVL